MRREAADAFHAVEGVAVAAAETPHAVIRVPARQAPDQRLAAVALEVKRALTAFLRNGDGAVGMPALRRAQLRDVRHHLDGLVHGDGGTVLGDVLGSQGDQLLNPETGVQQQADAVAQEVIGKITAEQLDFQIGEGILFIPRLGQRTVQVADDLGPPGGVPGNQVVIFGCIEQLDQHGAALVDLGHPIPALHKLRHKEVDMDGQDIRHKGVTQPLLDDLQGELVPIIGRRLHLGTVIRIPDVAPVTQRHGTAAEDRRRGDLAI